MVYIVSRDRRYSRLLLRELSQYTRYIVEHVTLPLSLASGDILIAEMDSLSFESELSVDFFDQLGGIPGLVEENVVLISRYSRRLEAQGFSRLQRPFRMAKLAAVCGFADTSEAEAFDVSLSEDGKVAYVGEDEIALTEREGALLHELLQANGAVVPRGELYRRVFAPVGEGGGEGIVNVYIHYLRSKLECDGRKLIYSRRGEGYFIKRRDV